ncbi:hypothetical protein BAX97_06920 [Elizabethkingia meningoseptica]|uniref:DUF5977 domain-containing protein n=1 Tax=Elizabethkingia meningoseptica TaxID=238 RepID=UPI00099A30F5|nr:DUF5977 domain-containing protein [Elizabethkingia meningoseptica]OPC28776.1 hypothetical protein BAX97_06920 [Elizabethkingia meningoseptica]
MKIKLINTFILFLCFLKIQAQDKTASSLFTIEKTENKQSLYTGIHNTSIPLLEVGLSDLKYKMNLDYSSPGFIPSISESIYGINWNANSLGSIVRKTKKKMAQPVVFNGEVYYNKGYNRCIRDEKSIIGTGTKKALLGDPSLFLGNEDTATYGFDPDEYYFDFFGNKGYFIFDNLGNPIVNSENNSIQVLPYDPLIDGVNCQPLWEGVTFSQFRLKDDKGNIFYFGGDYDALDINYVTTSYYSNCFCLGLPLESLTYNYYNVSKANYILEWKLKKVLLANGETIEANYRKAVNKNLFDNFLLERKNKDVNAQIQFPFPSNESLKNNNTPINWVPGASSGQMFSFNTSNSSETVTQADIYDIKTKISLLESVNFNNEYFLEYQYLIDNKAQPHLTNLKLKNRNKTIKDINFNQTPKGGNNFRYFLDSLTINKDKYTFEYYKTDQLPPKELSSKSIITNDLGFWNGSYPDSSVKKDNVYDATLLSKISYPTKGLIYFFYEPNDISNIFRINKEPHLISQSIKDIGGARIQKILYSENNSTIEYNYKKEDGENSSGAINGLGSTGWIASESVYGKIGYSRVEEKITGKGKNVYYYNNVVSTPDSILNTSPQFSAIPMENRRGKIIKEINIDNNDNKRKETIYRYKNLIPLSSQIKEISSNCSDCLISDQNYYVKRFTIPYVSPVYKTEYRPVLPYLPLSKTVTEYFPNGTIKMEEQISYNNKYLYWHPYPVETSITQSDETKTFKTYYPHDILREKCPTGDCSDNLNVGGQYSTYKYMIDNNIIKPIIITETNSKNKTKLTEHIYKKDNTTANILKENKTKVSLSNQDISPGFPELAYAEDKILFDLYDTKGNLLQYTEKGNKHTVIIWGYNQTKPIAKIEGITYNELASKLGFQNNNTGSLSLPIVIASDTDNIQGNASSEQILINALDDFRNNPKLSGYQITTNTYDPLIGITSSTPSSGIREIYKYDEANRLKAIVNVDGNILKEYDYQYKKTAIVHSNGIQSQVFTRNNCPVDAVPGTYNYTVPAGKYFSTISQIDADKKALEEISTNGQNVANIYALCNSRYCTVTPTHINPIYYSSFEEVSYNHIKAILSFPINDISSSGNNWSSSFVIGTLNNSCAPKSVKSFNLSSGGKSWNISINQGGNISIQLSSGSISMGEVISLNFEYDKN